MGVLLTAGAAMAGLLTFLGAFLFAIVTFLVLIAIALLILCGIANIFLFRKMGLPGWWGAIPIWSSYQRHRMTWRPFPWFWLYLAALITPWVPVPELIFEGSQILIIVLVIAQNYHVSKAFGHGAGYCIGLTLLPFVFWPMIGFGRDPYLGSKNE